MSIEPRSDWFASTVWSGLVSGTTRIVASGTNQAHHYFRLASVGAKRDDRKLAPHRLKIVERVLLGELPKAVAAETGCSTSTVAATIGDCLRAMGVQGGTSRVPLLLVLALHALRGKAGGLDVKVESLPVVDGEREVIVSGRLDEPLRDELTASELAVIRLLLEGKTHAEMAAARSTSVRTIANQIASAYRKLGVSGRMELLCHLVSRLDRRSQGSSTGSVGADPFSPAN
jgi:DNA-binding CsgD family transcriptional regulator